MTGLSAFIALCMTTDRSFQRTAASWRSVSPTMLRPWKMTWPPVIAAGRGEQLGDREQQGGLAAAGLAHDAEELARVHLEADLVHRDDRAAVPGVGHGQVADLQNRARRARPGVLGGGFLLQPARLTRILLTGRRAGLPISSNA